MEPNTAHLQNELDDLKKINSSLKAQLEEVSKTKDAEIEAFRTQVEQLEKALKNPSATKERSDKGSLPSLLKISSDIYVSEKYKGVLQVISSVWKGIPGITNLLSQILTNLESEEEQSKKVADDSVKNEDPDLKSSLEVVDGKLTLNSIKTILNKEISEINQKEYEEAIYEFRNGRVFT